MKNEDRDFFKTQLGRIDGAVNAGSLDIATINDARKQIEDRLDNVAVEVDAVDKSGAKASGTSAHSDKDDHSTRKR